MATLIPKNQIVYIYDLVKNIIAPGNRAFVSPEVQDTIDNILDERLPKGWRGDADFIKKLSDSFKRKSFNTYEGEFFPEYYAAYYLPNNLYKIQLMFLELFRIGKISFSEKKLMVLDIGSAVGTTAWALQDFYNIMINILKLYALKDEDLPIMEIDSIEKVQGNIDFFNKVRARSHDILSKVQVNEPILGDVLNGALEKVQINKYDVIFAANIICEFPTYQNQKEFAEKIINAQKESSSFVLVDTAEKSDTMPLKRIQYELSQREDVHVASPCGKLNAHSERCSRCWSFRRESLKIPQTMKLFSSDIDEADDNEKLKWSYTIFVKEPDRNEYQSSGYESLSQIAEDGAGTEVSFEAEIVSGKITINADNNKFYYLKICDQSEGSEKVILKIPKYFELPKYHFGDIFEIKNAKIEAINWNLSQLVSFALVIDPIKTTVTNKTGFSEPRGLIKFQNIEESNLLYFLKRFFGYDKFYVGQFDIIKKVLKNENVLGILATGGGKSITFQLPALLKPGVSVVVSPLKSLMDDQIYGMRKRFGFDFVDRIHSGMLLKEKDHVLERFRKGYLKILYVTPEKLQQKTFQKELTILIEKGVNINYFSIDEAHCISEWGHDFRPSYLHLKERQQGLPDVNGKHPAVIALTATASQKVQDDILAQLMMDGEKDLFRKIIDRKELSLEVIPLHFNVVTNSYNIYYRDPVNKQLFITKKFDSGTMRHEILEYILKEVLPERFDRFDISKDAGLIFTVYAAPSDKCREGEGALWLAGYLNTKGIRCKPWFAKPGFRPGETVHNRRERKREWEQEKAKLQDDFIEDRNNLLVTTKGFGMGIDKPNIRYIIHFGFPGALESYFQQIGRAGRDRKHSHCILLWDGPVDECSKYLAGENKIPQCFQLNNHTNKQEFTACFYHRRQKCDYAKQIYFIEGGYPTIKELRSTIKYLALKAGEQGSYPWVFLKKDYIKDDVGRELEYEAAERSQIKEDLLLEKLYTLKYISEFSQTYLKINIWRKVTMREVLNSTNSEIIKEHIMLLKKIYPEFLDAPATREYIEFDISKYIQKIRQQEKREVSIDEVVEFFNILGQREDISIRNNYENDFGYEIKLNEAKKVKNQDNDEEFHMITDWKSSKYAMLENIVKYAELQPFDQGEKNESQRCRRAHIMAVFGSEGAQLDQSVRCNYCDNCGFNNPWEAQASDIVAGIIQQGLVVSFRKFYLSQSRDKEYINSYTEELFDLIRRMFSDNFVEAVKIASDTWFEGIGEKENAGTNFVMACINYNQRDVGHFNNRLKIFFEVINRDPDLSQKVLIFLKETMNVNLFAVYKEHFERSDKKGLLESINIFLSSRSEQFTEIETEIGLCMVENLCQSSSEMIKQYERMNFHG